MNPELGVELLPLAAPVINRYVLDDDLIRERLAVWDAGHEYKSLARYFMRVQPRRKLDIVHNTFYLPHGLAVYEARGHDTLAKINGSSSHEPSITS